MFVTDIQGKRIGIRKFGAESDLPPLQSSTGTPLVTTMDCRTDAFRHYFPLRSVWFLHVIILSVFLLGVSPPVRAQQKFARILSRRILPGGRLEVSENSRLVDCYVTNQSHLAGI